VCDYEPHMHMPDFDVNYTKLHYISAVFLKRHSYHSTSKCYKQSADTICRLLSIWFSVLGKHVYITLLDMFSDKICIYEKTCVVITL